jgi:hypothetical protein
MVVGETSSIHIWHGFAKLEICEASVTMVMREMRTGGHSLVQYRGMWDANTAPFIAGSERQGVHDYLTLRGTTMKFVILHFRHLRIKSEIRCLGIRLNGK